MARQLRRSVPVDKQIPHAEHPVVFAFKAEFPGNPFVLAPRKASQKSSIVVGEAPVFQQLQEIFSVSFVASRANDRPT